MDKELVRSFLATFGVVFFAELGDKTSLATMAISGGADSARARWLVFAAAATALVATSAIGVLVGAGLSKFVSPANVQRIGGLGFILAGAWMLWKSRT